MDDSLAQNNLLQALFGDTGTEVDSISPRLRLWSQAFEGWLGSLQVSDDLTQQRKARRAWSLLLGFSRCPPWAIDRRMIDAWLEQMAKDGYSQATLKTFLFYFSSFYRFCGREAGMQSDEPLYSDPEKPFDPVKERAPLHVIRYQNASILTAEEARRLLRTVDREDSLLGKRDYAFLLTLLLTALPYPELRKLRWSGLRVTGEQAEIALPGMDPVRRLPSAAWEAIHDYLQASGRLESIQPDDYIFAPQADPLLHPPSGRPEDWIARKPISKQQALQQLKAYAAWAGLDREKVNYACIHHTAAALFLEQGVEAEELQALIGRKYFRDTQSYINHLGRLLAERGRRPRRKRRCPNFPSRGPYQRQLIGAQPGNTNSRIHGFYAHLLAEDFEGVDLEEAKTAGIDSEIAALRVILNRAFILSGDFSSLTQAIQFTELAGRTCVRIAKLLKTRQELRLGRRPERFDENLEEMFGRMEGEG